MIEGGYKGKILRIDLTKGKISIEKLKEKILRKYMGGLGIGVRMLYDEVPPGVAPLDPENKLFFMTGPLTGTGAPAATNLTAVSVNYETEYTVGSSHTHGFFGPYLKFAGYDGFIVEGRAEKPSYLWIKDDEVEIRDASALWGKDTHETEEMLKDVLKGNENLSVAAIGPAGENLCRGALIENDMHHSMSKCGMGGIMGSKMLKAIAVSGTGGVSVVDSERLKGLAKEWRDRMFKADSSASYMRNAGILEGYAYIGETSMISTKNLTTAEFPEYVENMLRIKNEYNVKIRPCWQCPIACTYEVEITDGPHKGHIATPSGGGENTEGSSSMMGVSEPDKIMWLTDLNDRLGFDSATAGSSLGLAFECYEKGILTKEDTGGLELNWGNAESVEALLRQMSRREGLGNILAEGPKTAAEIIGDPAPEFAVHMKGAGINLHDWRNAWSVLLGLAVGGGGPRWEGAGVDAWNPEPELGYPEKQPPTSPKGKAEAVRVTQIKKIWTADCLGLCWFSTWGSPVSDLAASSLESVTGWDWTLDECNEIGERVVNLHRAFNIKRGLTPEDDLDVSPRLTEAPVDGVAKGKSIRPYLEGMIKEYYRHMGWDEKTGKPWRKTLLRLNLEREAEELWG